MPKCGLRAHYMSNHVFEDEEGRKWEKELGFPRDQALV